jgi:hypothetical protein
MTARTVNASPALIARAAGFLYLLTVPLGIFTIMLVPAQLIVSGDAAATARNIMASESLFRLDIAAALVGSVIAIFYLLLLYKLLKPVGKDMAVLMVILGLIGNPISMLAEFTQLGVLQLLSGASYLTVFTTAQLQALAYLFLRLHAYGINISFIFAGLWLLPLGYLVFKSGFLPRILGILLILGGLGYLSDVFAGILFPAGNLSLGLITGLAEIIFLLWLLIMGVNVAQWKKRTAESA